VGFVVDEVGAEQVFFLVLWLSRVSIFALNLHTPSYVSLLTFMGPRIVNVFLSTTNKMQRVQYSLFNTANVGESEVSSDSPTLAVTANNFDTYPMLHVQFLSSR
jgi:hypothetical protein